MNQVVSYAMLAILVAVIALAFWPGRMNADTLVEISEIRSGTYSNQYAPILEAIWHPFYQAGFGPGWVLTAQLGLFVWGAFVLLRRWFSSLAAACVVAVISLAPQAFGELGLVGRDTWFLSLLVVCFACVSRALTAEGHQRRAWAGGALLAAWLTLASRQNAAASVFLPLAVLAGPWVARRVSARRHRRLTIVLGTTFLSVVATIAMMGTQLVVNRALSVQNTHSSAQLFLYDLASLSRRSGHDYIPATVFPSRSVKTIDATSNVVSANAMLFGPNAPVAYPFTARIASDLEHAWLHRIVADPLAYLGERLETFGWFSGLSQDSIWIYHPTIDPNSFGYHTTFGWANRIANDYERSFTDAANNGGALFAAWLYLLACCVIGVSLLRTRSWPRALVLTLAVSPLTYQVGLFFGLMGSNYRYEFPCIVLSELALAAGLRLAWLHIQARSAGDDKKASVSASARGVPIS